MERIWSKAEPGVLLHLIHRSEDFEQERVNLADSNEPLQVASLCLPAGQTFRPHTHVFNERRIVTTQELWVVVNGIVDMTCYDLDGEPLRKVRLHTGDCAITFRGGHTYEVQSNWARVYEVKNGPYKNQSADKRFLDG